MNRGKSAVAGGESPAFDRFLGSSNEFIEAVSVAGLVGDGDGASQSRIALQVFPFESCVTAARSHCPHSAESGCGCAHSGVAMHSR